MTNTKDTYVPYGPEWEKEMNKHPKAFLIDMIRNIKQADKPKGMHWYEVDKDALPDIDEFVIWRREDGNYFVSEIDKDGNYFVSEIDKDDYDFWNGRQTKNPLKDGYDKREEGSRCTHWARIIGPHETGSPDLESTRKEIERLKYDFDRMVGNDARQEEMIEKLKEEAKEYREALEEIKNYERGVQLPSTGSGRNFGIQYHPYESIASKVLDKYKK